MPDIKFEMSLKQLSDFNEALKRVAKEKRDNFLIDVRNRVVQSVEKNFQVQGRYKSEDEIIGGGRKWKKVSKQYAEWKRKKGYGSKIGTRTGRLRGSISGVVNQRNDNVMIRSDVPYAKFFDRKRPFMVVQPDDIAYIKRRAEYYVKEALRESMRKTK